MSSFSQKGAAPISGRRRLALWTVLAAQLMLQMGSLIIIVAPPRIQQDFGFNTAQLSWVPNASALALGGLLLLCVRLGDMIGEARASRVGLVVFVLASLMGGITSTPLILIIARVLQGVGASVSAPIILALAMVTARDDAKLSRNLSLPTAISSIVALAELILGGALTDFFSWRWHILIIVSVVLVIDVAAGRLVVNTHYPPASVDISGALPATLGSVALVNGFITAGEHSRSEPRALISITVAIVLFCAFFRIEDTHRAPLLYLKLLRRRTRVVALVIMAKLAHSREGIVMPNILLCGSPPRSICHE